MSFDLELLWVAVTAGCAALWLADVIRRGRAPVDELVAPWAPGEHARSLFPLLLGLLLLRSFVIEPYRIPSGSMLPNLLIGDLVVVDKYSYGLKLPITRQKVWSRGAPARGDVVVFRYPGRVPGDPEAGTNYIKRVIGLPGDVVEVADDQVRVNGQAWRYRPVGTFTGDSTSREISGAQIVREELPGRPHAVLNLPGSPFPPGRWQIPPGHYLMLGDNRDRSDDSRDWGLVPEANLVGRAMVVALHCKGLFCMTSFDATRIGAAIH